MTNPQVHIATPSCTIDTQGPRKVWVLLVMQCCYKRASKPKRGLVEIENPRCYRQWLFLFCGFGMLRTTFPLTD